MSGSDRTTGSDSTTGHASVPRPVHDNEGQTLAAWTACGGIIASSLVAAAALILGSIPLTVAALAVAAAGLIAGGLLSRARRGTDDEGPAGDGEGAGRSSGTVRAGTQPYDRESHGD